MKIVHIIPGTGGTFYCQNCIRDVALVRALKKLGHDIIVVPMYLPIGVDADGVRGDTPVFFGGINVYLQQHLALFRKTPHWMDRVFDSRWILRLAAAREGTTDAAGLGPLTLSMLKGADGNQAKELHRLIHWLQGHEKPDVIHLSNSLLLGLAGELRRQLRVPIVCTLQDEESWLDHIDPPFDRRCWEAMSECAATVDAFVVVSKWYADEMARRMPLPQDKVRVVPLGIELEGRDCARHTFDPPVVGYLSKMTDALGLGRLTDVFIELKQHPSLRELRLRATGGALGHDVAYVRGLKQKLADHGFEHHAEFLGEFDGAQRRDFLQGLSVLSVPSVKGEAFGLFMLEAMAAGVPVVQPNVGGYPEVIAATGGGIVYDHEESGALAHTLESLLLDPVRLRNLGQAGREAVFARFGIERMATDFVNVYSSLTAK